MYNSQDDVPQKLDAAKALSDDLEKVSYVDDEAQFRLLLNEDAMATEKLAQGIRNFGKDADTLLKELEERF